MNKKLLSLIAVFAGVGVSFAQPTFNSSDEAAIGTNITYYVADTTNFDLKESTNGANATWDYSMVNADTTLNTRAGNINDASGDATFQPLGAVQNFEVQDYFNVFYNFDATVKHSQGFRYSTAGTELAIVEFDTASYDMMQYPWNYTDMVSNTISGTTTINLQGNLFTASSTTGNGFNEYDGHGTLMLPDTTFTNVARFHQRDSVHATFGIPIGDIDFMVDKYEYHDPANADVPILITSRVHVLTDGGLVPTFDPIISVYSIVPLNAPVAGIEEMEAMENSIEIFPNPAQDAFTLRFDSKTSTMSEIALVDITGKTVQIISNGFSQGINVFPINVVDLTEGVYFVKISGKDGVITKKVIIQ